MQLNLKILIVDDVLENIEMAMNILKEGNYDFSYATSGEDAIRLMEDGNFDLILLDVMMPKIDGFETCMRIKQDKRYRDVPVIFITAKADADSLSRGFEVGGVDYITKPFHPEELLNRAKTHLELYRAKELLKHHNLSLQEKIRSGEERLLTELEETQKEIIYILAELMESASDETGKHIKRVAECAKLLAHYHKEITDEEVNTIYHAAPMHDIGKILIPREILHKKEKLTPEEFEVIKGHTTNVHKLLSISNRNIMCAADTIASEHHERWDGTGYPKGLKGEKISLFGRIVALADTFDALTHKRSYKEAWSIEDAAQHIIDGSGKHFDPYLVEIFKEYLDDFIAISKL